jgi:hypothetical protein
MDCGGVIKSAHEKGTAHSLAAPLAAALRELCELKMLKERSVGLILGGLDGGFGMQAKFDYERRKPEAWKHAFDALEAYDKAIGGGE